MVDLPALIKVGDTESIRDYFQRQQDNLMTKPRGLQPVQLSRTGNSLFLTYRFASDETNFDLHSATGPDRIMLNHMLAQIGEINEQGLKINSMVLRADLNSSRTTLGIGVGTTYKGEFGPVANITYRLIDKEQDQVESNLSETLYPGPLTLGQFYFAKAERTGKVHDPAGIVPANSGRTGIGDRKLRSGVFSGVFF